LSSEEKGNMKVETKHVIKKESTSIPMESMENNYEENNMIELRGSMNVRKYKRVVDIKTAPGSRGSYYGKWVVKV